MTRRMPRLVALAAVAIGCLALSAAPALAAVPAPAAVAASPDEAACEGTFYAEDARELFDLTSRYTPPALRAYPPTCASRLIAEPFDDGQGSSFSYSAIWYDISWDEFIAIVRSLEGAGYGDPTVMTWIDPAGGGSETLPDQPWTADQLAGLDPVDDAYGITSRNTPLPGGGFHSETVTVVYADGVTYQHDLAWKVPTLVIGVISTHRYDGTGLTDPSVLSGLNPFATPTAVQAGVIAGGAVVLMLIVGWPSSLLNSVVGSRYDALVQRLRRRPARKDAAPRGSRLPGWLMWPGFALAAILGAFVDPDFGWNPMSARVLVTLFLSFVLFNLGTWSLVRVVARRLQPDSKPLLRFRWGSLLLVALAVLLARLLQLEPGIIFGLVAGVAYATALRASRSAVIALVGAGFGLALGLVAWAGYSLLVPVVASAPDSVPLILVTEFLAGVTVKGVSSLPLALLPFGGLDGAKILKWRRVVWAVAYAIGLAAFMLVLLTVPKAWGEIPGDFVRWLVLFGGYALLALVVWIVNAVLLKRKPAKETPIGEQPDAITID